MRGKARFAVVFRARVDTRYLVRADHTHFIGDFKVKRGTWTFTHDRDEAHWFITLRHARTAIGSPFVAWASSEYKAAILVVGRPLAEWRECWPEANPIEMLGALA